MSLVKLDHKYMVCATCAFWEGPRNREKAFAVFDNKSSGKCASEAFGNWKVGAVSTGVRWKLWRAMKPYIVQLRGNEEWSYAQETQIVSHGQRNFVGTSTGIDPQPPFNLERVFYNRDRLEESYIRKHLLRLRDANMKYNKDRFP